MGRLLSWLVAVLSCQLFLFSYRTLKASDGSCHWWRASVDSGAWPFTDSSLEASMASKEHKKQNKSFKNTLLNKSDLASSNETNPNGSAINQKSASSLEDGHLNVNKKSATEAVHLKKPEKGESSNPRGKMDVSTFFNKLNKSAL